jgi:preprotein translocase subunit SecE
LSRAVRRQQAASAKSPAAPERARGGRQRTPRIGAGGGGPPTRGARPAAAPRRLLRVPQWLQDIISELRKVTWPTWPETRYLTFVVVVVSLAVGLMLGIIDIFFNWLIDQLLLQ